MLYQVVADKVNNKGEKIPTHYLTPGQRLVLAVVAVVVAALDRHQGALVAPVDKRVSLYHIRTQYHRCDRWRIVYCRE